MAAIAQERDDVVVGDDIVDAFCELLCIVHALERDIITCARTAAPSRCTVICVLRQTPTTGRTDGERRECLHGDASSRHRNRTVSQQAEQSIMGAGF